MDDSNIRKGVPSSEWEVEEGLFGRSRNHYLYRMRDTCGLQWSFLRYPNRLRGCGEDRKDCQGGPGQDMCLQDWELWLETAGFPRGYSQDTLVKDGGPATAVRSALAGSRRSQPSNGNQPFQASP